MNYLKSFAQPHGVSQNAAKASARFVPLQGLDNVVVQEPDATNLVRFDDTSDLH
jgi:hypothetical protein